MNDASGYRKKDGSVVSGEWMDDVARRAERDDLPGQVVTTQVHKGRPRLHEDEELITISFRLPKSRLEILEKRARDTGTTRSEFIRDALERSLVTG